MWFQQDTLGVYLSARETSRGAFRLCGKVRNIDPLSAYGATNVSGCLHIQIHGRGARGMLPGFFEGPQQVASFFKSSSSLEASYPQSIFEGPACVTCFIEGGKEK